MKKSVIRDIFYGKRGREESVKNGEAYWNIMDEVIKLYDGLIKGLDAGQKEILEKLVFKEAELATETALAYFTEGFKLGIMIGIECSEE